MKITDLKLEQYGIYRGVSWQPSSSALHVIMGENESGKTTLLRFIRDMLFGYERGKWYGKKGSMEFVRPDGRVFRVFQDEKKRWFETGNHVKTEENLTQNWWNGLNRKMYEKIFALGLEDLQGISFFSNDQVRSRFFMLQGGETLSDIRRTVQENKQNLLVASSQGKRKINQLMSSLEELNQKLDLLSNQEKDFSKLQEKQKQLKNDTEVLQRELEGAEKADQSLKKRLGAWEYYKRAREVKHQLDLSQQVRMFPSNGKEQWNQLMNRMKVIHDQKITLQEKLDAYHPLKKEEVIPWAGMSDELEKLYIDLGQWKQMISDAEALDKEKELWKIDYENLGYKLSLWDRPLDSKNPSVNVDWEEGRRISQSVGVRNNELHFWEKREPQVEQLEKTEDSEDVLTEKDWKKIEEEAQQVENTARRISEIRNQIQSVSATADKKYTVWFVVGIILLIAAAGDAFAFFNAFIGYTFFYAAGIFLILGILAMVVNHKQVNRKGSELKTLNGQMDELLQARKKLEEGFAKPFPETAEDLQAFHNMMQEKRTQFYKNQAKRQADSWRAETVKKQEEAHQKWVSEGEELRREKEKTDKEWEEWLKRNKLPMASADNLSVLQEQWQKIYSEEGRGKIIELRLEQMDAKLDKFSRRAYSIISATGLNYPVTPDSIAAIYEENQKKNLEWEAVQEKNHQYSIYEKEMKKLDDNWSSCQREMNTLLQLVDAHNAEEFAEKVNAHEHHDQLRKEWENVKQDLRLYAGSDEDFQKLWHFLETGQYDEWMKQHQEYTERIADMSEKLGNLQRQQGAVENEIFRLAGDDTITKILQQKQETETEIRTNLEEWITCCFMEYFLSKTQENYEAGKQPLILDRANQFLQAMTGGKYSLRLSENGKDISIIDSQFREKDSKIWSSGTGDQVYLAVRLAMALSFGEQVEPLPIVLDDIFVRFDETRQKETLRFLLDLGKEQQIFLFTCHARTMKIARELGKEKGTGEFIYLKNGKIEKAV